MHMVPLSTVAAFKKIYFEPFFSENIDAKQGSTAAANEIKLIVYSLGFITHKVNYLTKIR